MFNNRYTPHPWHILIVIVYLLIGTLAIVRDAQAAETLQKDTGSAWIAFGVGVYLLSFMAGTWICIGGLWREFTEYWQQIEQVITLLQKYKDARIWRAFGFTSAAEFVEVKVNASLDDYEKTGNLRLLFPRLPAPREKLYTFSVAMLAGQSSAKRRWAGKGKLFTPKEYDALMAILRKEDRYMKQRHKSTGTQGISPTRAGYILFQQIVQESSLNPYPKQEISGEGK